MLASNIAMNKCAPFILLPLLLTSSQSRISRNICFLTSFQKIVSIWELSSAEWPWTAGHLLCIKDCSSIIIPPALSLVSLNLKRDIPVQFVQNGISSFSLCSSVLYGFCCACTILAIFSVKSVLLFTEHLDTSLLHRRGWKNTSNAVLLLSLTLFHKACLRRAFQILFFDT